MSDCYRVGKAKIAIKAEGCINCGTQWSWAWETARIVPITIGKKQFEIKVSICGDCLKSQEANQRTLPLCA